MLEFTMEYLRLDVSKNKGGTNRNFRFKETCTFQDRNFPISFSSR